MMIVTMINTTEIANWNITSPLRSSNPILFDLNFPFNTKIGLYDESTNAG